MGHIVCKQGLLVDPTKIALILSLPPLTNVKMLQTTLGHMGYYRKFIRGYAVITTPRETNYASKWMWNSLFQYGYKSVGIESILAFSVSKLP